MTDKPPLIAHVIYHLYIGGLENGLINIINKTPEDKYRHAIICIVDYSDFKDRIEKGGVAIYAMHKKQGRDFSLYFKLYKLFRKIKPAIVHSRNLSGLDSLIPASVAGVKYKIHGEHGRDVYDLDGSNKKYQLLRKIYRPFITQYITVSKNLEQYLLEHIKPAPQKITQIYNGVDTKKFTPRSDHKTINLLPKNFQSSNTIIIGTVGRLQAVKSQEVLLKAFIRLLKMDLGQKEVRLVLIGDGPKRQALEKMVTDNGIEQKVWMPGARNNINAILHCFDIFVLPSKDEGISNTILEAMASALPIIATNVGGNAELVQHNAWGFLVPRDDDREMAKKLYNYTVDDKLRNKHAMASRLEAERKYSLDSMVEQYLNVYDSVLRVQTATKPIVPR